MFSVWIRVTFEFVQVQFANFLFVRSVRAVLSPLFVFILLLITFSSLHFTFVVHVRYIAFTKARFFPNEKYFVILNEHK